ncbi:tRNA wybutosine-synthesizing protein 3 homolog isoform 1-T1 [Salvelinus alpinus]
MILLIDRAVRSTHGLEVPLSHKGQVLVKEDYIYFLVEVANQKMEENVKQIERFYEWLQSAFQPAEPQSPSRQETEEKSVYKQRRKRGQTDVLTDTQTDACQDNRDINPVELEDCLGSGLDLFT